MPNPVINTHGMVCDFGKHRGTLYTRLPVSYLTWMINVGHSRKDIARAELDRRGTVTPDLDVSGHAIDRASVQCRKIWYQTRKHDNEGLHAWLCRISAEAMAAAPPDEEGRCYIHGMKLVFETDTEWPVLKTVMKAKS